MIVGMSKMNLKSKKWMLLQMIVFANPKVTYAEAIKELKQMFIKYGVGV